MTRIFKVESCGQCPNLKSGSSCNKARLGGWTAERRNIPNINKIPDWCPLEEMQPGWHEGQPSGGALAALLTSDPYGEFLVWDAVQKKFLLLRSCGEDGWNGLTVVGAAWRPEWSWKRVYPP